MNNALVLLFALFVVFSLVVVAPSAYGSHFVPNQPTLIFPTGQTTANDIRLIGDASDLDWSINSVNVDFSPITNHGITIADGTLTWAPSVSQIGQYDVHVSASGGGHDIGPFIFVSIAAVQGAAPLVAPDAPTGLSFSNLGSTGLVLSWTAPPNPDGRIVNAYEILRVSPHNIPTEVVETVSTTPHVVTGLNPGTDYSFAVRALTVNADTFVLDSAKSPPSNIIDITTAAPTPSDPTPSDPTPSAPTSADPIDDLAASAITNSGLTLSWSAPNLNGQPLFQYQILTISSHGIPNTVVETTRETSFDISGLPPNSPNSYSVITRTANGGNSGPSNVVDITTTQILPDSILDLAAIDITTDSLRLEWTQPDLHGSQLVRYQIYSASPHGDPRGPDSRLDTTTDPFYDVTGLTPDTQYSYKVRAEADSGNSRGNAYINATTFADVAADAITGLTVSDIGNRELTLNWDPASLPDSLFVFGYEILSASPHSTPTTVIAESSSNSFVVTNLNPDTDYSFAVRALTSHLVGDVFVPNTVTSPPSDTVNTRTTSSVDKITDLQALNIKTNGLTLRWSAPDLNGNTLDRYQILRVSPHDTPTQVIDDTGFTIATFTDLNPDTDYSYAVRTVTSNGETSQLSNIINIITVAALVTADPIDDLAVTDTTQTEITLEWAAPGLNGQTLDTYEIISALSDGTPLDIIRTTDTTFTVTDLSPDTSYSFSVQTVTDNGATSLLSNVASTRTAALVTAAPIDDLAVSVITNNGLTLSWSAPELNGQTLDTYEVITTASDGTVLDLPGRTSETTYTVTGLSPNTGYFFAVRTMTDNGATSSPSGIISATTTAVKPSSVDDLTATNIGQTTLRLEWTQPDLHGSELGLYRITFATPHSPPPGNSPLGTTTDTFFEVTGLNPDTEYSYRVAARTDTGFSGGNVVLDTKTLPLVAAERPGSGQTDGANNHPVVPAITERFITTPYEEYEPISFTLNGTDADGEGLANVAWSIMSAFPNNATINAETGDFLWIPNREASDLIASGTPASFTFTLTDINGTSSSQTASFSITDLADSTTSVDATFEPYIHSIFEGQVPPSLSSVIVDPTGNPPGNPDDVEQYEVTSILPSYIRNNLTDTTGEFRADAPIRSGYVTDAQGSRVANFDWRYTNDFDEYEPTGALTVYNVAHTITPPTIDDRTPLVSQTVSFDLDGSHPSLADDMLTWSILENPATSTATINEDTGVFSWTPDASHADTTVVFTFAWTDPLGAPAIRTETFDVMPRPDVSITIPSDAPENVIVDSMITIDVMGTGVDVTYSVDRTPGNAAIDPITGVFTWTPDSTQEAGPLDFIFTVTDNAGVARSATHEVTVVDVTLFIDTVAEGQLISDLSGAFSSPVSGVTYSIVPGSGQLTAGSLQGDFNLTRYLIDALDTNTGMFRTLTNVDRSLLVPGFDDSVPFNVVESGTTSLTYEFDWGYEIDGIETTQTAVLTITNMEVAPTITLLSPPAIQVTNDTAISIRLIASDPDNDDEVFMFSVATDIVGAAIDPATGVFTWTPTIDDVSPTADEFTFTVTDSTDRTDTTDLEITVVNSNADSGIGINIDPMNPYNELVFEGLTIPPLSDIVQYTGNVPNNPVYAILDDPLDNRDSRLTEYLPDRIISSLSSSDGSFGNVFLFDTVDAGQLAPESFSFVWQYSDENNPVMNYTGKISVGDRPDPSASPPGNPVVAQYDMSIFEQDQIPSLSSVVRIPDGYNPSITTPYRLVDISGLPENIQNSIRLNADPADANFDVTAAEAVAAERRADGLQAGRFNITDGSFTRYQGNGDASPVRFPFNTTDSDPIVYTFTWSYIDDNTNSGTQTATLEVKDANRVDNNLPPVIDPMDYRIEYNVGEQVSLDLSAVDPEDDTIRWTLTNSSVVTTTGDTDGDNTDLDETVIDYTSELSATIDPDTGLFRWIPQQDHLNKTVRFEVRAFTYVENNPDTAFDESMNCSLVRGVLTCIDNDPSTDIDESRARAFSEAETLSFNIRIPNTMPTITIPDDAPVELYTVPPSFDPDTVSFDTSISTVLEYSDAEGDPIQVWELLNATLFTFTVNPDRDTPGYSPGAVTTRTEPDGTITTITERRGHIVEANARTAALQSTLNIVNGEFNWTPNAGDATTSNAYKVIRFEFNATDTRGASSQIFYSLPILSGSELLPTFATYDEDIFEQAAISSLSNIVTNPAPNVPTNDYVPEPGDVLNTVDGVVVLPERTVFLRSDNQGLDVIINETTYGPIFNAEYELVDPMNLPSAVTDLFDTTTGRFMAFPSATIPVGDSDVEFPFTWRYSNDIATSNVFTGMLRVSDNGRPEINYYNQGTIEGGIIPSFFDEITPGTDPINNPGIPPALRYAGLVPTNIDDGVNNPGVLLPADPADGSFPTNIDIIILDGSDPLISGNLTDYIPASVLNAALQLSPGFFNVDISLPYDVVNSEDDDTDGDGNPDDVLTFRWTYEDDNTRATGQPASEHVGRLFVNSGNQPPVIQIDRAADIFTDACLQIIDDKVVFINEDGNFVRNSADNLVTSVCEEVDDFPTETTFTERFLSRFTSNDPVTLDLDARDAEDDSILWRISNASSIEAITNSSAISGMSPEILYLDPSNLGATINVDTGVFRWTPQDDLINKVVTFEFTAFTYLEDNSLTDNINESLNCNLAVSGQRPVCVADDPVTPNIDEGRAVSVSEPVSYTYALRELNTPPTITLPGDAPTELYVLPSPSSFDIDTLSFDTSLSVDLIGTDPDANSDLPLTWELLNATLYTFTVNPDRDTPGYTPGASTTRTEPDGTITTIIERRGHIIEANARTAALQGALSDEGRLTWTPNDGDVGSAHPNDIDKIMSFQINATDTRGASSQIFYPVSLFPGSILLPTIDPYDMDILEGKAVPSLSSIVTNPLSLAPPSYIPEDGDVLYTDDFGNVVRPPSIFVNHDRILDDDGNTVSNPSYDTLFGVSYTLVNSGELPVEITDSFDTATGQFKYPDSTSTDGLSLIGPSPPFPYYAVPIGETKSFDFVWNYRNDNATSIDMTSTLVVTDAINRNIGIYNFTGFEADHTQRFDINNDDVNLLDRTGRPYLDVNGDPLFDGTGLPILDGNGVPILDGNGDEILDGTGFPLFDLEDLPTTGVGIRPLYEVVNVHPTSGGSTELNALYTIFPPVMPTAAQRTALNITDSTVVELLPDSIIEGLHQSRGIFLTPFPLDTVDPPGTSLRDGAKLFFFTWQYRDDNGMSAVLPGLIELFNRNEAPRIVLPTETITEELLELLYQGNTADDGRFVGPVLNTINLGDDLTSVQLVDSTVFATDGSRTDLPIIPSNVTVGDTITFNLDGEDADSDDDLLLWSMTTNVTSLRYSEDPQARDEMGNILRDLTRGDLTGAKYFSTFEDVGAQIDPNSGIFSWTPTKEHVQYIVETNSANGALDIHNAAITFTFTLSEPKSTPQSEQEGSANTECSPLGTLDGRGNLQPPLDGLAPQDGSRKCPDGGASSEPVSVVFYVPNRGPVIETVAGNSLPDDEHDIIECPRLPNGDRDPNGACARVDGIFTETPAIVRVIPSGVLPEGLNVGEQVMFTLSGTDPDGHEAGMWSVTSDPPMKGVIDQDGVFSWTPTRDDLQGAVRFAFLLTDEHGVESIPVIHDFGVPNRAPEIDPISDTVDTEPIVNQPVEFTLEGRDLDGDDTIWGLKNPKSFTVTDRLVEFIVTLRDTIRIDDIPDELMAGDLSVRELEDLSRDEYLALYEYILNYGPDERRVTPYGPPIISDEPDPTTFRYDITYNPGTETRMLEQNYQVSRPAGTVLATSTDLDITLDEGTGAFSWTPRPQDHDTTFQFKFTLTESKSSLLDLIPEEVLQERLEELLAEVLLGDPQSTTTIEDIREELTLMNLTTTLSQDFTVPHLIKLPSAFDEKLDRTKYVDEQFRFTFERNVVDPTDYRFGLINNSCDQLDETVINPDTGVFTWTPTPTDGGAICQITLSLTGPPIDPPLDRNNPDVPFVAIRSFALFVNQHIPLSTYDLTVSEGATLPSLKRAAGDDGDDLYVYNIISGNLSDYVARSLNNATGEFSAVFLPNTVDPENSETFTFTYTVGNPGIIYVLNETTGDIITDPVLDEDGNPVLNESGSPVTEPRTTFTTELRDLTCVSFNPNACDNTINPRDAAIQFPGVRAPEISTQRGIITVIDSDHDLITGADDLGILLPDVFRFTLERQANVGNPFNFAFTPVNTITRDAQWFLESDNCDISTANIDSGAFSWIPGAIDEGKICHITLVLYDNLHVDTTVLRQCQDPNNMVRDDGETFTTVTICTNVIDVPIDQDPQAGFTVREHCVELERHLATQCQERIVGSEGFSDQSRNVAVDFSIMVPLTPILNNPAPTSNPLILGVTNLASDGLLHLGFTVGEELSDGSTQYDPIGAEDLPPGLPGFTTARAMGPDDNPILVRDITLNVIQFQFEACEPSSSMRCPPRNYDSSIGEFNTQLIPVGNIDIVDDPDTVEVETATISLNPEDVHFDIIGVVHNGMIIDNPEISRPNSDLDVPRLGISIPSPGISISPSAASLSDLELPAELGFEGHVYGVLSWPTPPNSLAGESFEVQISVTDDASGKTLNATLFITVVDNEDPKLEFITRLQPNTLMFPDQPASDDNPVGTNSSFVRVVDSNPRAALSMDCILLDDGVTVDDAVMFDPSRAPGDFDRLGESMSNGDFLALGFHNIACDVIDDGLNKGFEVGRVLVAYGSGGSSNEWKKKPTFGQSWEVSGSQLVTDGFTFNGYTLDITDNWHTDFTRTSSIIGETNSVAMKAYAAAGFRYVTLSLGVPEIGEASDAETDIILMLNRNYDNPDDYDITEIIHEQKESLVDESKTTATVSKVACNPGSKLDCYSFGIDFKVNAPLKSDVLAISAVDSKRRSTVTYVNEGVEFTGDSLLAPSTYSIVQKKTNQGPAEIITLTQQDRRYNIWEDDSGYLWTQNDHGSWFSITAPAMERFTDGAVNVMTRMHSNFGKLMDHEEQKATAIFNASKLVSVPGQTFSHDYLGEKDEISKMVKLAEELDIEQGKAQKIMELLK